jgi:hypothetical protein
LGGVALIHSLVKPSLSHHQNLGKKPQTPRMNSKGLRSFPELVFITVIQGKKPLQKSIVFR